MSDPKKKKKRVPYVDDGHTIYDMSGVGRPGEMKRDARQEKDPVGLTRKEKNAAIRAALGRYLPVLGIVLLAFGITFFLIKLWLRA